MATPWRRRNPARPRDAPGPAPSPAPDHPARAPRNGAVLFPSDPVTFDVARADEAVRRREERRDEVRIRARAAFVDVARRVSRSSFSSLAGLA